eukprot:7385004-Pyramimonas_sp.AAC.1
MRATGCLPRKTRQGTHSKNRSHHSSARATRPDRRDELREACQNKGARCTRAALPKTAEAPQLSLPASFPASA